MLSIQYNYPTSSKNVNNPKELHSKELFSSDNLPVFIRDQRIRAFWLSKHTEAEGKERKSSSEVSILFLREDKTLNGRTICVTLCKVYLNFLSCKTVFRTADDRTIR